MWRTEENVVYNLHTAVYKMLLECAMLAIKDTVTAFYIQSALYWYPCAMHKSC